MLHNCSIITDKCAIIDKIHHLYHLITYHEQLNSIFSLLKHIITHIIDKKLVEIGEMADFDCL